MLSMLILLRKLDDCFENDCEEFVVWPLSQHRLKQLPASGDCRTHQWGSSEIRFESDNLLDVQRQVLAGICIFWISYKVLQEQFGTGFQFGTAAWLVAASGFEIGQVVPRPCPVSLRSAIGGCCVGKRFEV
jgi:hypothetical protein